MTYLYVYRMSVDSGFAPCVKDKLLSLACCKGGRCVKGKECNTGIRYWIGSKTHADYEKDKVYVLGTYKDKLLYIAKITEVVEMLDYFNGMSKGRLDDIYNVVKGKLKRNRNLLIKKVHKSDVELVRDSAGKYVLLSDEYVYLGEDSKDIEIVRKYNAKGQETKQYTGKEAEKIVEACFKHQDNKVHNPTTPLKGKCR